MTARAKSKRHRKGLFMTWAGDSLWRRFIAWLAQTAILAAIVAATAAIVWFVLVPTMIDGMSNAVQNSLR